MSSTQDFFAAIQAGDVAQVVELLAREPSLREAKNASSASAVLWAVYTGQRDIARLLVANGAMVTLYEAAALGLTEHLARILGADPQRVNDYAADGFTAMGLAAFFGQGEAVEMLLARGALPNRASNNAQRVTPLHSAVAHQHVAIARMLIAHGAEVDARQESDFTPLQEAAHHGSVELVRMLLAAGATVDLRNAFGKTALDYAQENGNAEVTALLEQKGGSR